MARILSVTELNQLVKMSVESSPLLKSVVVRGEAIGVKCYRAKNSTWFTVKDGGAELSCVFWGISEIKEGDEVEISGRVTVWTGKGKYQLTASRVSRVGEGLDKEALARLNAELEQKGYFDPRNKKALPTVIRTAALVTSEEGAAVGDVLSTLRTRGSLVYVKLYNVSVQGQSAPAEIAAAIQQVNAAADEVDVILLTRGGGGKEDLVVFNDPLCFEAVHSSRIPIICAIGHERDLSIAEKCADFMCITPTDAAVVLSDRSSRERYLQAALQLVGGAYERVMQRLRGAERQLLTVRISSPQERIARRFEGLRELGLRIERSVEQILRGKQHMLENLTLRIEAASPFSILDRGYALVYKDGKLMNLNSAAAGDDIRILMNGGTICAEIKEVLDEDIRTKIGRAEGHQ